MKQLVTIFIAIQVFASPRIARKNGAKPSVAVVGDCARREASAVLTARSRCAVRAYGRSRLRRVSSSPAGGDLRSRRDDALQRDEVVTRDSEKLRKRPLPRVAGDDYAGDAATRLRFGSASLAMVPGRGATGSVVMCLTADAVTRSTCVEMTFVRLPWRVLS